MDWKIELIAVPVTDIPWGRFVYFDDPDGNGRAVRQAVPQG